jgi:hypothetical protein
MSLKLKSTLMTRRSLPSYGPRVKRELQTLLQQEDRRRGGRSQDTLRWRVIS